MRNEIRNSPYFLLNWIVQTRSIIDIQKRADYLVTLFKKELYDTSVVETTPLTKETSSKNTITKKKEAPSALKKKAPSKSASVQRKKEQSEVKKVESEPEESGSNSGSESSSSPEEESYAPKKGKAAKKVSQKRMNPKLTVSISMDKPKGS